MKKKSPRAAAAGREAAVAAAAEEEKIEKYEMDVEPNVVRPAGIELTGGWGPHLHETVTDWINQLRDAELVDGGTGWGATLRGMLWQQRIAQAVHRSVAERMRIALHLHPAPSHEDPVLRFGCTRGLLNGQDRGR